MLPNLILTLLMREMKREERRKRGRVGSSLYCTCVRLTYIERAQHTYWIVRKTTIICLGRQQTHKTFRFISHHRFSLSLFSFFSH